MHLICVISGGKGPVILEHMNDAYAMPGASAAFECRVVGEPIPHITWYVQEPSSDKNVVLLLVLVVIRFSVQFPKALSIRNRS